MAIAYTWLLCCPLQGVAQVGTFTPPMPPAGLLLAGQPEPLARWQPTAGLALQNDLHPLIYAYSDGRREPIIFNRARLELQGRLGLGYGWDIAASLPLIYQWGKHDPYLGPLQGGGLADLRLQGRYALLSPLRHTLALTFAVEIGLPTGNRALQTGGLGHVYPHVTWAYPLARIKILGQVGWLWRPVITLFQVNMGPTLPFHLGIQIPMLLHRTPVQLLIESASQWTTLLPFQPTHVATELLFGIRWQGWTQWQSSVGLGTSLGQAPGAPLVRLLASWMFSPPQHDQDGDGLVDADDACPMAAETYNQVQDADGCPESDTMVLAQLDQDQDGIEDRYDACPTKPEHWNGRADLDGCPEAPDQDQDGLADEVDRCPTAAETINGKDDQDGCPDEGMGQTHLIPGSHINLAARISFEIGKSTIKEESFALLDEVAAQLLAHQEIERIRIEGHTDNVGTAAGNLRLSQARAESVRRYLIERGVAEIRLVAQGFGESQPIADNQTEATRMLNRRVAFVILANPTPQIQSQ